MAAILAAALVVMLIWGNWHRNNNQTVTAVPGQGSPVADGTVSIFDRNPPITGTRVLGETVTADLSDGGTHVWTFAGEQGMRISITADFNWDNHITLGPPDAFDRMGEAYDDLGGGTAILCNKVLEVTGDYRIYVDIEQGRPENTSGPYTLTVALDDAPAPESSSLIEVDDNSGSILMTARSPCQAAEASQSGLSFTWPRASIPARKAAQDSTPVPTVQSAGHPRVRSPPSGLLPGKSRAAAARLYPACRRPAPCRRSLPPASRRSWHW
jgi:hypothetical protein